MIENADGLRSGDLTGFFVGWPRPPSDEDRLAIIRSAPVAVVARGDDDVLTGFATAITDHRFAAYISLVEVLPEHQGRGVGTAMVRALLARLDSCYMVDLVCDDDVVPFYERLGGTRLHAVAWRYPNRLRD